MNFYAAAEAKLRLCQRQLCPAFEGRVVLNNLLNSGLYKRIEARGEGRTAGAYTNSPEALGRTHAKLTTQIRDFGNSTARLG